MYLLQNPFHVLKVSPLDMREKIIEVTEEQSLFGDAEICTQCSQDLLNPKKRLAAEIAWFTNSKPERLATVLHSLEKEPEELISLVDDFSPCDSFNLLASGLSNQAVLSAAILSKWIAKIDAAFNSIKMEDLLEAINNNRLVSGFPQVDLPALEEALQERRYWCRGVINSALNALKPRKLVESVTLVIDMTTNKGESHTSVIIDDIINSYELGAQKFFEKEIENIERLLAQIHDYAESNKPDSALSFLIAKLIQVVENWDSVAQPIQVSTKSQGILHKTSKDVADKVRKLYNTLFYRYSKLDFAQKIYELQQKVFAEVVQVVETTEEDARKFQEWRDEITYETFIVGSRTKNLFRISPDGIEWKGKQWKFEEVNRLRWGGVTMITTRSSPFSDSTSDTSNTLYTLYWGDDKESDSLNTDESSTYSNILDRLIKTCGERLYIEMLKGLRDGKQYDFGVSRLSDTGMFLRKERFLSGSEQVYCTWKEIRVWNGNGAFCMCKSDDEKVSICLPYLEVDNVHILEILVQAFFQKGRERISSLLDR